MIIAKYSKNPQLYSFMIAIFFDIFFAYVFFASPVYKYSGSFLSSLSILLALGMFYYIWVAIFFTFSIGSATDVN